MSIKITLAFISLLFFSFSGCAKAQTSATNSNQPIGEPAITATAPKIRNTGKVIHVLVALCDNVNQGIVPVPAHLGNGEDAVKNLYWGAAYGVKTYFSKSKSWAKLAEIKDPKENVLERIIFKHKTKDIYLIADAYRGSKMRETIDDFFSAASGERDEKVSLKDTNIYGLSGANLIAFVGHDGLMDFKLEKEFIKKDNDLREAIILACASKGYFAEPLKKTGAKPLLWTSNLMAPEAYILHDALDGWANGESDQQIRIRAAAAYAKYQRIGLKSSQNLLVTGW